MKGLEFHLNKTDIRKSEFVEIELPDALADGETLLAIDRFALTANNITYAVTDVIGYWKFFPTSEPWGVVPVWGFADVITSSVEGLDVGERVYGFFPFASHLIVTPARITSRSFADAAPHRADLPPIYNEYMRAGATSRQDQAVEDMQMLFQPLFATSFLLHDFFTESDCFGAESIILGSASSKTAMGVAQLFAQHKEQKPRIIGLTSAGNKSFVESLGDYDQVFTYEDLTALPPNTATAYIDMAGNGAVKRALHEQLQDKMVYSCAVGKTHWDKFEDLGPLPGAPPKFFFAPDQAMKRRADWGGVVLQQRITTALQAWAEQGMGWLEIVRGHGMEEAGRMFAEVRDGRVAPNVGYVLSLRS